MSGAQNRMNQKHWSYQKPIWNLWKFSWPRRWGTMIVRIWKERNTSNEDICWILLSKTFYNTISWAGLLGLWKEVWKWQKGCHSSYLNAKKSRGNGFHTLECSIKSHPSPRKWKVREERKGKGGREASVGCVGVGLWLWQELGLYNIPNPNCSCNWAVGRKRRERTILGEKGMAHIANMIKNALWK